MTDEATQKGAARAALLDLVSQKLEGLPVDVTVRYTRGTDRYDVHVTWVDAHLNPTLMPVALSGVEVESTWSLDTLVSGLVMRVRKAFHGVES